MGELSRREEEKKRCCLDCHNLSRHFSDLNTNKIQHRTWNEFERSEMKLKYGARVICAEDEWSGEEIDSWESQDKNVLTKDRSNCPSFDQYKHENRYSYIERYRQIKKETTDKRRFLILAAIGLATLLVGVIAMCRPD